MSVRKISWNTRKGLSTRWIVSYSDQNGKRRHKNFRRKSDADTFAANARIEIRHCTHVADSASVTVQRAGELWLETCNRNKLERSTLAQYGSISSTTSCRSLGATSCHK